MLWVQSRVWDCIKSGSSGLAWSNKLLRWTSSTRQHVSAVTENSHMSPSATRLASPKLDPRRRGDVGINADGESLEPKAAASPESRTKHGVKLPSHTIRA